MTFNYPTIMQAFKIIDSDNGRPAASPIPRQWSDHKFLQWVDEKLAQLTEEELETFCVGEHTEMLAIQAKYQLAPAWHLLEAYFEEWYQ